MRVLIVEDDRTQNEVLANFLRKDGIEAVWEFNLSQAEALLTPDINLLVLDLNLPDGHGFDFLRNLRKKSSIPVIVLTALDDELTQLNVFELQADEYVDKPVSPLVMTKRIQAHLNRVYPPRHIFHTHGFSINFEKHLVTDSLGREIPLTAKEFNFLKVLIERKGNPVLREHILEAVWGFEYREEIRLLDSHVKNIRKKLTPQLIRTVKNVGYRIDMKEDTV